MFIRGFLLQKLMSALQFAKRLGEFKLKALRSNMHSCLDVNVSFVIYVKRLLMHITS